MVDAEQTMIRNEIVVEDDWPAKKTFWSSIKDRRDHLLENLLLAVACGLQAQN